MPVKWKLFRIVNYLHVAAAAGVIVFICSIFVQEGIPKDLFLNILVFGVCPLILATNCLINLNLLDHYYPNRLPGKRLSYLHILFFILFIIIAAGVIAGTLALFYETLYNSPNPDAFSDWRFVIILGLLSTISVTSIPVCCLQNALRRRIKRNFRKEMEGFLAQEIS